MRNKTTLHSTLLCLKHRIQKGSKFGSRGIALPYALLMMLLIGITTAAYSTLTTRGAHIGLTYEATAESFFAAEAALNLGFREVTRASQTWIEMPPIGTPANYQIFSKLGGLPNCSGSGCERNFVPMTGGLIKNFGDTSSTIVSGEASISEQINAINADVDLQMNNAQVWYQIERLDQAFIDEGISGISLDPSAFKKQTRFRVTATARRTLRGQDGEVTLVSLITVYPL